MSCVYVCNFKALFIKIIKWLGGRVRKKANYNKVILSFLKLESEHDFASDSDLPTSLTVQRS